MTSTLVLMVVNSIVTLGTAVRDRCRMISGHNTARLAWIRGSEFSEIQ